MSPGCWSQRQTLGIAAGAWTRDLSLATRPSIMGLCWGVQLQRRGLLKLVPSAAWWLPPSHLTLACLEGKNLDSVVQPESLGLHCGRSPGSGAVWWSVSASHAAGWGAGRRPVSGPHGQTRAHEHLSHLMRVAGESQETLHPKCPEQGSLGCFLQTQ